MKKIKPFLLVLMIFAITNIYSQSYKNIEDYNTENTKIATFTIDTTRYLSEEILVLTRVLYSYPDIYFADVKADGNGIVFMANSSIFEKFLDELYNSKSYILTNISENNYSDELFLNTYIKSSFISTNNNGDIINKVRLGIDDKDNMNFEIAKSIYNK